VIALALCALLALQATDSMRVEMIPMRDGVKLKTFILTPPNASGAGPLPIIMQRTPYGAEGGARNFPGAYRFLAAEGNIFVFQDIRGSGGS
jgi:predicted acyl esterase